MTNRWLLALAALVVLAGCSDDREAPTAIGAVGALVEHDRAAATPQRALDREALLLRAAQIASAQRRAGPAYNFEKAADGAVARIRSQALEARLHDGTLHLAPDSEEAPWSLALRWSGVGRRGDVRAVEPPVDAAVERNRASYRRSDGSEEWYLSGPLGIEQGFVIAERPEGDAGELVLQMSVAGSLDPVASTDGVSLTGAQGERALRYTDLLARAADETLLSTWMQVEGGAIELHIDDDGASYPLSIDPLIWTEVTKLFGNDTDGGDGFGKVAVDGDMAVVGAQLADTGGVDTGAAYIFARAQGGADKWGLVTKLVCVGCQDADRFGHSVAISGDVVVVGADLDDTGGTNAGAAYVFARDEGGTDNWGQVKKLVASDAQDDDRFGTSVAISGDVVLVGAYKHDSAGLDAGAAFVFSRNAGGTDNWGQLSTAGDNGKLTASDAQPEDRFGGSVSVSGDVAIVGAWLEDEKGDFAGAAYVFSRNHPAADNWGQLLSAGTNGKLTASDAGAGDQFGKAVAISGDFAIIGAPLEDTAGSQAGAAYVFSRTQGGNDHWGEVTIVSRSVSGTDDRFGNRVSVHGTWAVVGVYGSGDSGAAFVFSKDEPSPNSWGETTVLTATDAEPGDSFGGSVAVSGDVVIVGASGEDSAGTDAGAAYVFRLRNEDGDPCSQDHECVSVHCVDGVCCDAACGNGDTSDCLACSTAKGGGTDGV